MRPTYAAGSTMPESAALSRRCELLGVDPNRTMTAITRTLAACVIACTNLSCGSTAMRAATDFDPAIYAARPYAVMPHVWVLKQPIGHEWHGNATLIEQERGLVLVDTGGSAGDGRHIVALLRSLSSKPLVAVILTHWHDDHSLGLSAVRDAWPNVRIIAAQSALEGMQTRLTARAGFAPDPVHEADRVRRFAPSLEEFDTQAADAGLPSDARRAAAESAAVLRYRLEGYTGSYIVRPTEVVTDRLTIADALAPVEVAFLGRANTQGDLVIHLPRQRAVIVGDIVVAPVPFGYGAFPGEWAQVLRKLDAMDFDVMVPGHGEPMQSRLYLRLVLWSIEDVRTQVARLVARGSTLDDVKQQIDYSAQRERWAPRDPSEWLDAITTSAFNEATGIPNSGGL